MTEHQHEHVDPAPVKLVFVLDGRVVDLLSTQDRLGAILLSQPLVLDVSDLISDPSNNIQMYAKYDNETGKFTPAQFDEDGNLLD
jgi:hypothetical protein